jgi:hypothetical protein
MKLASASRTSRIEPCHFEALADSQDSPFGALRAGECLDYRGVVMYRIRDRRFYDIRVAYNSFSFTGLDGARIDRGIPH